MEIGDIVTGKEEFTENDVIIDNDGEPWRFFADRWSSKWSAINGITLARDVYEHEGTVKTFGLTTEQLFVRKIGYGPFTLIWRERK